MPVKTWKHPPRGTGWRRMYVESDGSGNFTWEGDMKPRNVMLDHELGTEGWQFKTTSDDGFTRMFKNVPYYLKEGENRTFIRDSEGRGKLYLYVTTVPLHESHPFRSGPDST
jgi:hypothetical protein